MNQSNTKNMFWLIIPLILFLTAVLLSGCAVIKSSVESSNILESGSSYYYLPKGLLNITSKVKIKIYSKKDTKEIVRAELITQEFEHSKEIIPDTKNIFQLSHNKNALANDELTIKISSKGLLESIDIIAEDRLPNIVETLTNAPSVIFSTGGDDKDKSEYELLETIKEYTKTVVVDPSELTKTFNWLISVSLDEGTSSKDVKASFQIKKTTYNDSTIAIAIIDKDLEFKGIFTRPVEAIKFTIEPQEFKLKSANSTHEFFEYLPSQSRLIKVPISRALFAKKENNLVFTDGMLTENEIKKPSEVEGFISIPINIAKAIISIPAQLFQFRIDNTKKDYALETEIQKLQKLQNTILQSERNKLTNQLAIDKLVLDAKKSLLDTQKAIDDLKTQIESANATQALKNEKELLQLQKDIADLKKQIEELKDK